MSAEVTKNPHQGNGPWLAWCEECQDGVQSGKATATRWADMHNNVRHPA